MPQDKKKQIEYINPYKQQPTRPVVKDGYINPYNAVPQVDYINPYETVIDKAKKYAAPVLSKLSPVFDVLSRGQYASAAFFDATADDSKTFFDSVSDAFNEILPQKYAYSPQTKMSFSDVIKKRNPEFAKAYPSTTEVVGFVGDIALDPTSYLGVGLAKTGTKVGTSILSNVGEKALKEGVETAGRIIFKGKPETEKVIKKLKGNLELESLLKQSKIKDDQGKLIKVYHGTTAADDFKTFDVNKSKSSDLGYGISFSDSPDRALREATRGQYTSNLRLIPAYLDLRKPLKYEGIVTPKLRKLAESLNVPVRENVAGIVVEDIKKHFQKIVPNNDPLEAMRRTTSKLEELGYDGIVSRANSPLSEYVVFDPKKIRSATTDTDIVAAKGYFQAVKERVNELNAFAKKVTGQDLDLADVGKSEILSDLKRVGSDTLNAQEVRERVENRILNLVNIDPKLSNELFAKEGIYLKVGLPFGKQRDLARIAGTEHIKPTIKLLNDKIVSAGKFGALIGKAEDTIAGAFNRNYNLPEEYIKQRDEIENYLGYAQDATIRDTYKLFKGIDKEGKERIGEAMQWIDDQSRNLEQLRGIDNVASDEYEDVIKLGMNRAKLKPEEQAAVALLYQDYKDMALAEMRAGLLSHNLANYSPRGYNAILDEGDMTTITRGKYREAGGPNPYLSSSQERKFLTNAEAKAAGLDLEMDAAILYANRLLSSRRAVAIKQFKDSVESIFGTYQSNAKYAHTGILPTGVTKQSDIPKRVLDDMRMIGETVMPSGLSESTKNILKFVDMIQRPFNRGATVYRPTFAARQIPSNTIQAALISGVKAFKAFDPRSAIDAGLLLFRNKETKQLPDFLNNFINNTFGGSDAILAQRAVMSHIAGEEHLTNFATQWSMRNPFGEKITGVEMVEEMRQNGVFRGFDASGDGFTKKLNNELDRNFSNKAVALELGKFWKHASLIEDYNRAMLYINGRRLGHSPKESAKIVNKALFDYQRGLSNFEKQVLKRIRPFYSFQRFAIPYVLRQTLAQPGNFATTQKLVGTIEKLIVSGESLNPAEREQIPGFILEQPNLFSGMDKDGKAVFNSLNNLTPFDALNLTVFDKDGNVDYKRSAEKATFGALSPFLKIPIEIWADRNIFTEKTIEEASKLGDVSQNLSRVIPQAVKDLISWEDRVDKRTGKKSTYMNPYLAYTAMNYFPVLRDYIKPLDAQTSPLGAALNIALEQMNPVKRTKIDLKAQSEYEMLRNNKEVKELLKEIQSAILIGSKSKESKAQQALADLIKTMGDNQRIKQGFEIRGQGIAGKVEEGQEQSITNPAPNPTQIIK